MSPLKHCVFACVFGVLSMLVPAKAETGHNPIIFADVPDPAIIRVGNAYYMSSTTMHMSPGVPIMKSTDLVNWEIVNYAYDTLDDTDQLNLANGKSDYGRGSWASSICYHEGTYYVSTFSNTTSKTYVYTTKDIEKGLWKAVSFKPKLHDHSLFFDDDGRVYMVSGSGRITLTELLPDATGVKPGGINQVIIEDANTLFGDDIGGLKGEGSHLQKINGKYYLFNVASPKSKWSRTVLIHRADRITGPYEGRIGLQDRGIAQGGLVQSPQGDWYAYLFRDYGAVGRMPYLLPVKWEDNWPVIGDDGKAAEELPKLPANKSLITGIVASDEFDRRPGDRPLPLVWQWNHNPDNALWSLTAKQGALRLTTGRVDADLVSARNTLTQRTFGPESSASTVVDIAGMKDGDLAGLCLLQRKYGFVGVKMNNGAPAIVRVDAQKDAPVELANVPLRQNTVYLKADCDFRNRADTARFFYSLDGKEWQPIGGPLKMTYDLKHFVGYRFGLFHFATQNPGGCADFDFFRVSDQIQP